MSPAPAIVGGVRSNSIPGTTRVPFHVSRPGAPGPFEKWSIVPVPEAPANLPDPPVTVKVSAPLTGDGGAPGGQRHDDRGSWTEYGGEGDDETGGALHGRTVALDAVCGYPTIVVSSGPCLHPRGSLSAMSTASFPSSARRPRPMECS